MTGSTHPAAVPLTLLTRRPSVASEPESARDGLPFLDDSAPLLTRVYANAGALPSPGPVRPGQLETNVQLIDLGDGAFCLNHALRQQQFFGGQILAQTHDRLTRGEEPTDPRLTAALREHGLITSEGGSAEAYHRGLMLQEDGKETANPSFTLLRVLLTDVCNLSCSYCKVIPNVLAPQAEPTSENRLEEVIQFFFENSVRDRPKIIHISGGEPTLFFHQVERIVELKQRYERPGENCWLVLGTNATLIREPQAAYLAEHDIKCIVSMDGPEEVHDELRRNHGGRGSWRMVDRGLRLLKKHGAEVSLSMVLGTHNLERSEEIISWFLEEYAPTGLGVNFMKPPTPDQKDFASLIDPDAYAHKLYGIHKTFRDRGLFLELVYRKLHPFVSRQYRFHDCGAAGGTNLNVDAKGSVGPCKSFLLMDKLALKTLDAASYRDIVISKWRKRSPVYYEACEGCSARAMCGNGCAYDAMVHSGDEMAIDVRSCQYTRQFNRLFLEDLFDQVRTGPSIDPAWWHVPTQAERQLLLGAVEARPRTLSYSIGHQTQD